MLYRQTSLPGNIVSVFENETREGAPFVLGFPRKKADVQSEPNPACWGAVCAGADWSLPALALTPTTATSQGKGQAN